MLQQPSLKKQGSQYSKFQIKESNASRRENDKSDSIASQLKKFKINVVGAEHNFQPSRNIPMHKTTIKNNEESKDRVFCPEQKAMIQQSYISKKAHFRSLVQHNIADKE